MKNVAALLCVALMGGGFWYLTHPSTTTQKPLSISAPAVVAPALAQPDPNSESNAESGSSDQTSGSGSTSDSGGLTFHGYACTIDCSGHEAGYNWAEEHDITDRDDCPVNPHNSHSFTEGCWAYADESSGSNDGDNT